MILTKQGFRSRVLLAASSALAAFVLSWLQWAAPVDRLIYDTVNEFNLLSKPDDIVIITVDERSLLELGRWPWPRENHVELINKLTAAQVKAVALDIIFSEPDQQYPEVDRLLAESIKDNGRVVLPIVMGQFQRRGLLFELQPLPEFKQSAASLGHVHIEVDSDGLARSVYLKEGIGAGSWPHFSVALVKVLGLMGGSLPGVRDNNPVQQNTADLVVRDYKNLIPFVGPAGSFDSFSFVDIVQGRIDPATLQGKVVFVGAEAAGLGDYITTSLGQLSGVELNANIFHALRSGELVQPLNPYSAAMISALWVFFSVFFGTRLAPLPLLLAVVVVMTAVPAFSAVLLIEAGVWFPPAAAAICLAIAYPFWNWLRLNVAIHYMRHQLGELRKEHKLPSHQLSLQRLVASFDFLYSAHQLTGWRIEDKDGAVLHCKGEVASGIVSPEELSQWAHRGSCSRGWVMLAGAPVAVILEWSAGSHQYVNALTELLANHEETLEYALFDGDVINENIQKLEEAFCQAQHTRTLITSTLEQQASAVILTDYCGQVLFANEQSGLLFGDELEGSDVLNRLQQLVVEGNKPWTELFAQLLGGEGPFIAEAIAASEKTDLLCRGKLIKVDQPLLLLVFTDVTLLKITERKRAEALNFLSHDLRAPLTSVLALLESVRSGDGRLPDQLLDTIEQYVRRNLSYSENFIQLAKLESPVNTPLQLCDIYSLIDNAIAQVYHTAKQRNISVTRQDVEADIWLECDRNQIERALVNLLDNALKHSPDGSVIAMNIFLENGMVSLSVVDQGSGIAEDQLRTIFDRYKQGDLVRGGVGLGLHFVSLVAKAHQGSVDVSSHVGKGSAFSLTLPAATQF